MKGGTPLSLAFDQFFLGLRKRDPELASRTLSVLRKLNSLANGPTSRYAVTPINSGKSEDNAPPPAHSLFHHYLEKFTAASNDLALAALVSEAEVECQTFSGRRPAPRGKTGPENDKEAQERVIAWYEGDSPEEVALKEGDRRLVEWVKKARTDHRRNPSDGKPLRGWDGWDHERRIVEIRKTFKVVGKTQATVAAELSITERTLRKYWPQAVGGDSRAA